MLSLLYRQDTLAWTGTYMKSPTCSNEIQLVGSKVDSLSKTRKSDICLM